MKEKSKGNQIKRKESLSKERLVKVQSWSSIQTKVFDLEPKVADLNQGVEILKESKEEEEAEGFTIFDLRKRKRALCLGLGVENRSRVLVLVFVN